MQSDVREALSLWHRVFYP